MQDYYALLDLPVEFTPEELRAAYRAAMRCVHPDVAGDSPEANARAVEVNEAYQTFSNHSKRWDYDIAHPEYRRAAERRHAQAAYDRGWDTAGAGRFGREDRTAAEGVRREPKPWAEPSARAPSSGFSPGLGDVGDSSISRWNDGGRDLRQAGRPDGAPKVDIDDYCITVSACFGSCFLLAAVLLDYSRHSDYSLHSNKSHQLAEILGLLWCVVSVFLANKLDGKFADKGEWLVYFVCGIFILLGLSIACAFIAFL